MTMKERKEFERLLLRSFLSVGKWSSYMALKGKTIMMFPYHQMEPGYKKGSYSDSGDLLDISDENDKRIWDVKHKTNFNWTCRDDFPRKQIDIMNVGNYRKILDASERLGYRLDSIAVLSSNLKSFVIIPFNTCDRWKEEDINHKQFKGSQRTWVISKEDPALEYGIFPNMRNDFEGI